MPGRYMYPATSPQPGMPVVAEPVMQSTPVASDEQTTQKVSFKEQKKKVSSS